MLEGVSIGTRVPAYSFHGRRAVHEVSTAERIRIAIHGKGVRPVQQQSFRAFAFLLASSGLLSQPSFAALLVAAATNHQILAYSETTGDFLGVFIEPGVSGLDFPVDMLGLPDGTIAVSGILDNRIHRYDRAGNSLPDLVPAGSGGLVFPSDLKLGPEGYLYVGQATRPGILRFNASTGEFIDEFGADSERLDSAGYAFGPDGDVFVASAAIEDGFLVKYFVARLDGTTGESLGEFVPRNVYSVSRGIAFGPDGNLYVISDSPNGVLVFDGNSAELLSFIPNSASGFSEPNSITLGPDGLFYVGFRGYGFGAPGFVRRLDPAHWELSDDFILSGAGGLTDPAAIAFLDVDLGHGHVVPGPSGGIVVLGALLALALRRRTAPQATS